MKKSFITAITTVLALCGVLVPTLVIAHAEEDTSVTTQTTSETLQTRLEKKKAELQVRLDEAQKERIKTRCSAAQDKVGTVSQIASSRSTAREQAYSRLVEKLEALVAKLKAKQIDTTTLEAQINELKAKITTFNTHMTAYKQALQDVKDVDCSADQEAFQAALLAARTARQVVVDDALAIRVYVNDPIKKTIQTIREQLKAAETTTEPASTTTEGSN